MLAPDNYRCKSVTLSVKLKKNRTKGRNASSFIKKKRRDRGSSATCKSVNIGACDKSED